MFAVRTLPKGGTSIRARRSRSSSTSKTSPKATSLHPCGASQIISAPSPSTSKRRRSSTSVEGKTVNVYCPVSSICTGSMISRLPSVIRGKLSTEKSRISVFDTRPLETCPFNVRTDASSSIVTVIVRVRDCVALLDWKRKLRSVPCVTLGARNTTTGWSN